MDTDRIKKVCTGLELHGNGICQAKDGSICPYWSIGATCSRQMTSDAIFVIRKLEAENEQLRKEKDKYFSLYLHEGRN